VAPAQVQAGRVGGVSRAVARVAELGIDPPEDDQVGAISDLSEGGGGAAPPLPGQDAGGGGVRDQAVERSAEPVGDAEQRSLRLAGEALTEEDQQAAAGGLQQGRGRVERLLEIGVAPVHPDGARHPAVAEPHQAERAGVLRAGDAVPPYGQDDIVAGAAAAQAGDMRVLGRLGGAAAAGALH
jgi:hypothetical protein